MPHTHTQFTFVGGKESRCPLRDTLIMTRSTTVYLSQHGNRLPPFTCPCPRSCLPSPAPFSCCVCVCVWSQDIRLYANISMLFVRLLFAVSYLSAPYGNWKSFHTYAKHIAAYSVYDALAFGCAWKTRNKTQPKGIQTHTHTNNTHTHREIVREARQLAVVLLCVCPLINWWACVCECE